MGWKINLWARALDGDHARKILNNALRHSNGDAGVFYNLFDSHAPFQIDGNFGACAGMAEMLMQSNSGTIRILPALPSAWKTGHIDGMKAVGDFTVSIQWKNNKPTLVTITSNQGQTAPLVCEGIGNAKVYVNDVLTTDFAFDSTDQTTLSGEAGTVYVFDFEGTYSPPTSIDRIENNAKGDGQTYNLQGQKVGKNYRGIVIRNGKKTVNK